MKRILSIALAVLFFSGIAVAQNEAIVTQQGPENESTVDQKKQNYAEVNQESFETGNTATVSQQGKNNQYGAADGHPGYETENMMMFPFQSQGGAYINQYGDDNDAGITQKGKGNHSRIDQGFKMDGEMPAAQSMVLLPIMGFGEAQGNDATTYQEGKRNSSYIGQLGDENTADFYVKGRKNTTQAYQAYYNNTAKARVRGKNNAFFSAQFGAGNVVKGLSGERFQIRGKKNEVTTMQLGFSNTIEGKVRGKKNSTEIYQYGASEGFSTAAVEEEPEPVLFPGMGENNLAEAEIRGKRNETYIEQVGNGNTAKYAVKGKDNDFTGTQMPSKKRPGENNWMEFDLFNYQDGSNNGNKIVAKQRGENHSMKVIVKGDQTKTFDFSQRGNGNVVKGLESGDLSGTMGLKDYFFFEGDRARQFKIAQKGKENLVEGEIRNGHQIDLSVNQRGHGNFTELDLEGRMNMVDVTQRKHGNETDIYQRGGFNSATVFQKGKNNSASITQTH